MLANALALTVLVICLVLMVRLMLSASWRYRFDFTLKRWTHAMRRRSLSLWHWRSSRKDAARVAEDAIRRAREGGTWEGNVYKPKSFRRPRKPH